jgi:hypothetical protein
VSDEPDEQESILRRVIPFMGVAIVIAALYVAWTFYSRWNSNQEAERARSDKEVADARRTVELMGNGEFKIMSFYAVPMGIRRGEHSTMCFGVSAAKSIKIEPEVEPVKPTLTRCLPVSPKKTTEYTLTAEDGKGHTVKQSFVLQVFP